MRRILLLVVICSAVASAAAAAWTRAGLYGADVRALAVHPAEPDVVFVGTSQGEIYISRDGGKSWKPARPGIPFPGFVVDNLLIDSKGRLWSASWGLWDGGVIAVSGDLGATWTRRDAGLEDFSVRAIAIDPSDSDHVVVGGLTGVYRSRDAGRNWDRISELINVESLAIDPRNPDRIYVGTWRQAFRTDDGGANWALVNEGMVLDTDVFSITIDPKNPDNIWLSTCGWVYNSTDGGDKWVRFKEGFNNRRIHAVAIDPQDSNTVFAGSVAGLYRTPDLGKTWQVITDEALVINGVGLHPERPQRILLGTEGDGVYLSEDGGASFVRSSEGLHNVKVAAVVADPDQAQRVYAAVLFGGSSSGIYRSDDAGKNWERLNKTKLPEVLSLLVRRDVSPRFIAGTEQGVFISEDGEEWNRAEPVVLPIRVARILPYNRTRLFAATSEGVFTTRDSGKSWYRLGTSNDRSVDLALGTYGFTRALYALKANGLSVFDGSKWMQIKGAPEKGRALALSSSGEKEILVITGVAGVRAGYIDEERAWNEVSVPDVPAASALSADRGISSVVYLASRESGKIYVHDQGERWKSMQTPLRLVDIAAIANDPFNNRRIYLATSGQGLFIYNGSEGMKAEAKPERETYSGGGAK